MKYLRFRLGVVLVACVVALVPVLASAAVSSFIGQFNTVSTVASTVPRNGDVNPYGVAVVPRTVGALVQGNILVSNFTKKLCSEQAPGESLIAPPDAPDGALGARDTGRRTARRRRHDTTFCSLT